MVMGWSGYQVSYRRHSSGVRDLITHKGKYATTHSITMFSGPKVDPTDWPCSIEMMDERRTLIRALYLLFAFGIGV